MKRDFGALSASDIESSSRCLSALLSYLRSAQYHFITPTPSSQGIVLGREPDRLGRTLQDIFGWSLPFEPRSLDGKILRGLQGSGVLVQVDGKLQSRIRVSSLGADLFLHSAYPTDDKNAVFFGPDTYRFARLIRSELARPSANLQPRVVDMGAGAGAGAIVASRCCPGASLLMTDVNAAALVLARLNALSAGVSADYQLAEGLSGVEGLFDVILANPPYLMDEAGRDYRDGGAMHGAETALVMTRQALAHMAPGGRFVLYTGSAILEGGADPLFAHLRDLAEEAGSALRYEDLDPDIFGEELRKPAYRDVERIALISAIITAPGPAR